MVTRRKLRAFLSALGLYAGAAALVGYFGVSAYTGNHGLRAKQDLDHQFAQLSDELARLKRERIEWQHRIDLLKPESIDPDTLDERAREVLGYVGPGEITMILKPGDATAAAAQARPNSPAAWDELRLTLPVKLT